MFGRLFKPKPMRVSSVQSGEEALYACALAQTRKPVFYSEGHVPDSFDGRFDLLLLHVFLIFHRLMDHPRYGDISQRVFDVMFKDMDQTLRERGIGDMGVPKHMKRMMKAFNGRMHAYLEAVQTEDSADLHQVLARNLFGTIESLEPEELERMGTYVRKNIEYLKSLPTDDIAAGTIQFAEFDEQERENG